MRTIKNFLGGCSLLISVALSGQQHQLPLWDNVPNQKATSAKEQQQQQDILRISQVQHPNISIYLPSKPHATGQAVVICPGGGYQILAYDWEGTDIAKWLNSKGIAGIVLKYRLPSHEFQLTPRLAPIQDAKQAIRLVRKNAASWNIDPNQVGVMGFSAGGHLASTLGTQFDDAESNVANELAADNARPDFMILVYPVISMSGNFTHKGSRNNLLGEHPAPELIKKYSSELQVSPHTPPTFLVHSSDDLAVPVENSLRFYQALVKHGVSAEMHVYPNGGHGYSLALDDGHLKHWPELLVQWLENLD
jgi:acetyl esterase/lipase